MSEIDDIIIGNIKQIGCDFEESTNSIEAMPADLIVEAISKCLLIIQPGLEISINSKLPANMAHRFKIGTKLAACVKELGYRGDVGYDTFLYSNATEVRRVFMFLIDKLPKEQHHDVKAKNLSPMEILKLNISIEMKMILKKPPMPSKPNTLSCHQHQKFNAIRLLIPDLQDKSAKMLDYYDNYMKPTWSQTVDPRDFLASILHTNALHSITPYESSNSGSSERVAAKYFLSHLNFDIEASQPLINASNSNNTDNNFEFCNAVTKQIMVQSSTNFLELPLVAEDENDTTDPSIIESLKDELSSILDSIKSSSDQINIMSDSIKESENRRIELTSNFDKYKEDIARRKKLLQLLPGADHNLEKLKAMYNAQTSKLLILSNQFDSLKLTLQTELINLEHKFNQQSSDSLKKKEMIEEMEAEMKQLLLESQEKESLYQRLINVKNLESNSGRSQYTDRILEIVESIKKQNYEIDKVLSESHTLSKEVNSLVGILERTYLVTDELVFKDAKTDGSVKKTYKLLAAMHENFATLRKSIEDTGSVKKEISDLEEQLESKMKSKFEINVEKANNDLQLIKQENKSLIEKIKAKQLT